MTIQDVSPQEGEDRKELLRKIGEKRKYSRQEMKQKEMLDQLVEKFRFSIPEQLVRSSEPEQDDNALTEQSSEKEQWQWNTEVENPFGLAVCPDPSFDTQSPLFAQSNCVTFPEEHDKTLPEESIDNTLENIDYPADKKQFARNSDQLKTVTFFNPRRSNSSHHELESQTELRRMRADNQRHDSEEQGLRKDSKEQMEFISSQQQNAVHLNRVKAADANGKEKNDLSQLLAQSSDADEAIKSDNLSDNFGHLPLKEQANILPTKKAGSSMMFKSGSEIT